MQIRMDQTKDNLRPAQGQTYRLSAVRSHTATRFVPPDSYISTAVRLSVATHCPSGHALNNNPNHTKIAPFHVPASSSVLQSVSTHSQIPNTQCSTAVVEQIGSGESKLYRNTWSSQATVHIVRSTELTSECLQVLGTQSAI
jgi:hypothetical protein